MSYVFLDVADDFVDAFNKILDWSQQNANVEDFNQSVTYANGRRFVIQITKISVTKLRQSMHIGDILLRSPWRHWIIQNAQLFRTSKSIIFSHGRGHLDYYEQFDVRLNRRKQCRRCQHSRSHLSRTHYRTSLTGLTNLDKGHCSRWTWLF